MLSVEERAHDLTIAFMKQRHAAFFCTGISPSEEVWEIVAKNYSRIYKTLYQGISEELE